MSFVSQYPPQENPFGVPEASPVEASQPPALVSLRGVRLLRESQRWATTLGVVGVLLAIVNIINLVIDLNFADAMFVNEFAVGYTVGVTVRSIVILLLLILPSLFLFAYAGKLRVALSQNREDLLPEALSTQRRFWMTAALVVTITFVLFCVLLSVAVSMAAQFAAL